MYSHIVYELQHLHFILYIYTLFLYFWLVSLEAQDQFFITLSKAYRRPLFETITWTKICANLTQVITCNLLQLYWMHRYQTYVTTSTALVGHSTFSLSSFSNANALWKSQSYTEVHWTITFDTLLCSYNELAWTTHSVETAIQWRRVIDHVDSIVLTPVNNSVQSLIVRLTLAVSATVFEICTV